jgi:hypothetical protein
MLTRVLTPLSLRGNATLVARWVGALYDEAEWIDAAGDRSEGEGLEDLGSSPSPSPGLAATA